MQISLPYHIDTLFKEFELWNTFLKSSQFRMFFFAWQLTVVNRNETKQRKQDSEGEAIVLSPDY